MKTGEYTDKRGRKWYCIAHPKEGRMICNSEDHSYTVANFKTFKIWGWTLSQYPQETASD